MSLQSLEGRYYSDPAIFAAERKTIFERCWQLMGHESQVAKTGDYISTKVAGANVIIVKGNDGKLRGFRNVCRHRGGILLRPGEGNCAVIQDPYHGWLYGLDGELIDTPWHGQPSPFDLKSLSLYPLFVETWRGLIFLAFDPQTSLLEQLGDLPAHLEAVPMEKFSVGATRTFSAPINWKIYCDQYCEAYHVPLTHSPDKAVDMQNYHTRPHDNMMLMQTVGDEATQAASYYGGRWIWAWPNWTIALFDGGAKLSRLDPSATAETVVRYHFLFADMSPKAEETRTRVVDATSSIFWEDIAGCQLVQANHPGTDFSGPLHPELEQAVAYFQDKVRNAVASA